MPVEWTASDTRLVVSLDRSAGALRSQLERALRESIHSGRLRPGERLPPSRQVAAHLGISRGLVTDCYAQLSAEGYLTSRPGSPTRVAAAAGAVPPPLGARLGWALAPTRLVAAITAEKRFDDRAAPLLDQLALAMLISSGRFDRHLRSMRKLYSTRRQNLVTALGKYAPAVQVTGLAAGLHAVARLPAQLHETLVVTAARARGIGLRPMSAYRLNSHNNGDPQLVFGYGHLPETTIEQGITTIADLICGN